MDDEIQVLMAGGGTAGHVFPALAVAVELARRGRTVSWAGRSSSMEQTLVEAAGLPFHQLDARPWVGKGVLAKVGAAATLARSSLRARRLVRGIGADVILGTGGYVSAPAVLGARLTGRPAFVFEPNAQAGAANRLVARWATGAFAAHEATVRQLACPVEVTGIPVRAEFHGVGPLPAGRPHLLVLGGSQGARQINELMPAVVKRLFSELPGLTVTHQVGGAHVAAVESGYRAQGVRPDSSGAESSQGADGAVSVVAFIDDVAAAMAAAHLVVSRAGALATAELAAAGRPAILVPLTAAGAGHQRFNAERMEAAGAAVALSDESLSLEHLDDAILSLLGDRSRLETMSSSARKLASPTAAARIAEALTAAGGRN